MYRTAFLIIYCKVTTFFLPRQEKGAKWPLFDFLTKKREKATPLFNIYMYFCLVKKPAEAFADYVQNTFGVDMDLTAG